MYQVIIHMIYFAATDALILMIMAHVNHQFRLIADKMSSISSNEDIKLLVDIVELLSINNEISFIKWLIKIIFKDIG